MSGFISTAMAAGTAPATAAAPNGGIMSFLPLIAIAVVFYFLLIRPQQARAKKQRALIESVKQGDEVIVAGGIVGKVLQLTEDGYLLLEVAQGQLRVLRASVSTVLPKGTLK